MKALTTRIADYARSSYGQAWRVTRRGKLITITSREGTASSFTSEHISAERDYEGSDYAMFLGDAHAIYRSLNDN